MTEFDLTPKGQQGRVRNFTIDHRFKTDWGILAILLVFTIIFATLMKSVPLVQVSEVAIANTEHAFMERLLNCESGGERHPAGSNDNGKAHGYFQLHKTGLEDIISYKKYGYMGNFKMGNDQFHSMAFDYQESYYWTHYAIFESGSQLLKDKWLGSYQRMATNEC